jgi:acetyltransferase
MALKIVSPEITHKSDVGGVALDLDTPAAARAAALAMAERVQRGRPHVHLNGFLVQPMVRRPRALELLLGVATDPVFGPVILFGQGGTAAEVVADRALALPPLNRTLACDLIARTRVARLLGGYRDHPPVALPALADVLVRLGQLACDLPEVVELDINPLLADGSWLMALDARVRLAAAPVGADRLAIRPYPRELERPVVWRGEHILLRPIRPEDAAAHARFFAQLTPDDIRLRLFAAVRTLAPAQLARLTQIDYDREMAIIAVRTGMVGPDTLGVARAVCDPDNEEAEFAIVVRSDLKGQGLGHLLLGALIDSCRQRGTSAMVGVTLRENQPLLKLAASFGFQRAPDSASSDTVRLRLDLRTH